MLDSFSIDDLKKKMSSDKTEEKDEKAEKEKVEEKEKEKEETKKETFYYPQRLWIAFGVSLYAAFLGLLACLTLTRCIFLLLLLIINHYLICKRCLGWIERRARYFSYSRGNDCFL